MCLLPCNFRRRCLLRDLCCLTFDHKAGAERGQQHEYGSANDLRSHPNIPACVFEELVDAVCDWWGWLLFGESFCGFVDPDQLLLFDDFPGRSGQRLFVVLCERVRDIDGNYLSTSGNECLEFLVDVRTRE